MSALSEPLKQNVRTVSLRHAFSGALASAARQIAADGGPSIVDGAHESTYRSIDDERSTVAVLDAHERAVAEEMHTPFGVITQLAVIVARHRDVSI